MPIDTHSNSPTARRMRKYRAREALERSFAHAQFHGLDVIAVFNTYLSRERNADLRYAPASPSPR
jgi:hypothetical protein